MKGNEGAHASICTLQNKKRHDKENIKERENETKYRIIYYTFCAITCQSISKIPIDRSLVENST
jgi:hypothetical protein